MEESPESRMGPILFYFNTCDLKAANKFANEYLTTLENQKLGHPDMS